MGRKGFIVVIIASPVERKKMGTRFICLQPSEMVERMNGGNRGKPIVQDQFKVSSALASKLFINL